MLKNNKKTRQVRQFIHQVALSCLTSVAVQVLLEMVRLRESFPADLAGEGPLTGVSSHVFLQVACLGERTAAHAAHEPTLAGVNQHVTTHRRVEPKGLGADGALVRTLPGVTALVVTQLVQAREVTAAVFTRERSLTYAKYRCMILQPTSQPMHHCTGAV